jgi:hypothetical protein
VGQYPAVRAHRPFQNATIPPSVPAAEGRCCSMQPNSSAVKALARARSGEGRCHRQKGHDGTHGLAQDGGPDERKVFHRPLIPGYRLAAWPYQRVWQQWSIRQRLPRLVGRRECPLPWLSSILLASNRLAGWWRAVHSFKGGYSITASYRHRPIAIRPSYRQPYGRQDDRLTCAGPCLAPQGSQH